MALCSNIVDLTLWPLHSSKSEQFMQCRTCTLEMLGILLIQLLSWSPFYALLQDSSVQKVPLRLSCADVAHYIVKFGNGIRGMGGFLIDSRNFLVALCWIMQEQAKPSSLCLICILIEYIWVSTYQNGIFLLRRQLLDSAATLWCIMNRANFNEFKELIVWLQPQRRQLGPNKV